jgi:anti-anti-sigma factor
LAEKWIGPGGMTMDVRWEGSNDEGQLSFRGNVTQEHVHQVKEALLTSLSQVNQLILNFHEAQAIDLTCLQLLCSAHRTSVQQSKHLSIRGISNAFQDTVELTGFSRSIGCIHDSGNSCLWTEKK